MPHGYIIASIEVVNPQQYEEYRKWSTPAVQAHGGEFLVRGGQQQVLEGGWHSRTVVIRFADYAKARAFYDSAEYLKARHARAGAALVNMVCIEEA